MKESAESREKVRADEAKGVFSLGATKDIRRVNNVAEGAVCGRPNNSESPFRKK